MLCNSVLRTHQNIANFLQTRERERLTAAVSWTGFLSKVFLAPAPGKYLFSCNCNTARHGLLVISVESLAEFLEVKDANIRGKTIIFFASQQ